MYEYANNTKGAVAFEYINVPGISTAIVQVFPLSESKTYIYTVSYKHTSDQSQNYYQNDQLLWNAKRDADPGVEGDSSAKISVWFNDKFSTDLKVLIGLLIPLFILLIISMANVEIGVFFTCALFILFNQWGFYETTWIAQVGWINWVVAVFMILNVISFYRKLRRTT